MTVQTINIGNVVNDGTGDDLRTAFQKVNANFQTLENSITVTAANIGLTGQGIFAQKVGNELQFKNIVPGNKITIDSTSTSIVINASPQDAFTSIITPADANTISATTTSQLTLIGDDGIEVTSSGSTITFGLSGAGISAISVYDFGPLNGNYTNAISFLMAATNVDFGTFTNPGSLNFDLGAIV